MDVRLNLPARIYLQSGHFGTVKFFGPVDGTTGLWLGVEWDNPDRGKHDGIKGGKRYFECRIPNTGSFIRPSSSICYGYSFLQALNNKYVEAAHGTASQEKVILGSSNGTIEVEAVNLDKIRGKYANLDRLREVSLDKEKVATSDDPGKVLTTCPNIRGLDLSATLLSSWDDVAMITAELPHLERLALNRNRLKPPPSQPPPASPFLRLSELQLNGTLTSWEEFTILASFMPRLQIAELGYNELVSLSHTRTSAVLSHIEVINFDSNKLGDWRLICEGLEPCTSLKQLVLSSNCIATIPSLESRLSPLRSLKVLFLSSNNFQHLRDIDRIYEWCPELEMLRLANNPLTEAHDYRQQVIAKIPSLHVLDATTISAKERSDSELYYLSLVTKTTPARDEDKIGEHPQWVTLCIKHGKPSESSTDRNGRLSEYLIDVHVHHCCELDPGSHYTYTPDLEERLVLSVSLRVLSTMQLGLFRLKVMKALAAKKNSINRQNMRLWLRMGNDTLILLENNHKELGWWGIENGSHIYVYIPQQN